MIAKEINITHTGQILASFIIGLCLCLWTALNMKPSHRSCNQGSYLCHAFYLHMHRQPVILLAITFMLNYLIMGINRYHSIPIAITSILRFALRASCWPFILLKQLQSNHHFQENTKRLYLHHIGLAVLLFSST